MKKAHFLWCLIALLCNGCSIFYVVKQGVYQFELLSGAEPIEMALRRADLDHQQRKKLELILDVRRFAKQRLKLNVRKNYQDVNLGWHRRIHSISASATLAFKPYLWWFPLIGWVPYKGYFDEADADAEQKLLEQQGFETQKREIHGYSTLGYFSDPVWPAMLLMSDQALIELIIHELAHATVYIPDQTPFNETFANFVGKNGARAYVIDRYGLDSKAVVLWDKYDASFKLYHQFFHGLYGSLDHLYNQEILESDKQSEKGRIFADANERYGILVNEKKVAPIEFSSINNAYLLSFKNYNEDFEVFEKLMSAVGGNFDKFIDEVNYYGRTNTPFISLHERVKKLEIKK